MNAKRSHSITFLVNNLLVLLVICSEEGNSLLHIEGVFESLINLPFVIALLSKDEWRRVR